MLGSKYLLNPTSYFYKEKIYDILKKENKIKKRSWKIYGGGNRNGFIANKKIKICQNRYF